MRDNNEDEPAHGPNKLIGANRRVIPMNDHKIESGDLFIGTREVIIHHGGDTYRLRLTAQNKLILTK